jgi:type II secretory pathway pseudopilin PulG
MKCRNAYSLLELIVVMALLGMTTTLLGTLMATAWGIDTSARRELALTRSLGMCELQLRDDLHRSDGLWLDGNSLNTRPDATHTLIWQLREGEIVRELWEADTLRSRQQWPLPPGSTAAWQLDSQWATLTLSPKTDPARPTNGRLALARSFEVVVEHGRITKWAAEEETP